MDTAPGSDDRTGIRPAPAGGEASYPETRRRLDRRLHRSYRKLHAVGEWFRTRVTPAGALVFWATLAAGTFTDVGQTMAHQVFALLFGVLVGAMICLRGPRPRLAVERTLPRRASAGTAFTYRLRFRNLGRRRVRGREFREGLPDPRPSLEEFAWLEEPGESRRNGFDRRYRFYRWRWLMERRTRARPSTLAIPELPAGGAIETTTELLPLRRGRLTLHGARIVTTDPFGLLRRLTRVAEEPASVVVYPRRFQLPPLQLPGRVRRLHTGGVAFAGSVGESEEFVSVREYRPGDPLRRIHWSGWARTGRPVVKEFQEEYYVRNALILDTCGGGPQADAFEDAVSLAASFACTVDEQDSLLDLMFVGDVAYVFSAGRGVAHTEQMLDVLAGVELHPRGDLSALQRLVTRHSSMLSGCIVLLLAWDPPRRRLCECLRSLGLPLMAFVIHSGDAPDDPDRPADVHWVPAGKVEETLDRVLAVH